MIGDLNSGLMAAKIGPLVASGWAKRITFLSQFAGPPEEKVDYLVVPDAPGFCRRTFRRVRAAFAAMRRRPGLIVAYNVNPFGYLAWLLSRLYGVPYGIGVISGPLEISGGGVQIENRLLARFPFLAPVNERMALFALRRALFVTTTGNATRDYLIGRGIPKARVYVLPSVVDPARFHPRDNPRDIDVVCLTNLIARKRVDRLFEIAKALRPKHPGLKIEIVGDGPLQAELKDRVRAMGLESCIGFAGWQGDVRPFLWRARIFALTSVTEGLPLALIEAMGCGVPGVVGRVGDVEDIVIEGKNGCLVPEGDVEAYTEAIDALLADPARRDRLAAAAGETVASGYTVAAGVRTWARIHADWIAPEAGVQNSDRSLRSNGATSK